MPKSVKGVMDEWKSGTLHSGSKKGPVVKNQRQAIAIALSEQHQKSAKGSGVFNANEIAQGFKRLPAEE